MSKKEDCDPWDPRCSTLPKPELFTAVHPYTGVATFTTTTYEKAMEYLIEYSMDKPKYPRGVIHKHHTEIVYFNKETKPYVGNEGL